MRDEGRRGQGWIAGRGKHRAQRIMGASGRHGERTGMAEAERHAATSAGQAMGKRHIRERRRRRHRHGRTGGTAAAGNCRGGDADGRRERGGG